MSPYPHARYGNMLHVILFLPHWPCHAFIIRPHNYTGEKNYPFRKETSDFDYGFNDGTSDKEYLDKIKYDVPRLIDSFEPDFIFYLSGVDIIENDKLGRLSVSIRGCKERDRFVLNLCKTNRIPVQVSMGGGYSFELKNIIEAHSNTFRLAQEIFF